MDSSFTRTDRSILGLWWWTIDRFTLTAILILILFGCFLVSSASPPVANRIGLDSFHFVYKHLIFLIPSLIAMFLISMMNRKMIWRLATLMLIGCFGALLITPFIGAEIKGATRWIHLFGFSIQPSEFAKPAFAVTAAWLIAKRQYDAKFPGRLIASVIFISIIFTFLMQPDFGMSVILSAIFGVQIFLSGLSMSLILGMVVLGIIGIFMAYTMFPHVASRIDRFLDPSTGDNYQVEKSLEAFSKGGLFGTGPAQGEVKKNLPDAHADFIFSVAGEELGLILTLIIVALFIAILIRTLTRIYDSKDLFVILAVSGILTQFTLQTLVHMCSSLRLMPAKGMTLPFISYGGSSMLALGIGMGMLLALTKKRNTDNMPIPDRKSWSFKSVFN